jgi:hypothetical protein
MKATMRGRSLTGLTAALILAAMVTSCADSSHAGQTSSVTCNSYAIHGSGRFQDEIWVRVQLANRTSQPAHYTVDVELDLRHADPGAVSSTDAMVSGLVAANSSAELGRKVLTTDAVSQCRIVKVVRS